MLFEQDADSLHNSNNFVVLFNRNDLPFMTKTDCSAMQVSAFASDNFNWFYVDKEYLMERINAN